jgi:hypothetical protein
MKNTPHLLEENQVSIQSAECGWKGGIEQATLADWALFLEFLRRVRERLSAPLRPQILNLSRQNIFSALPFNETKQQHIFQIIFVVLLWNIRNSNRARD